MVRRRQKVHLLLLFIINFLAMKTLNLHLLWRIILIGLVGLVLPLSLSGQDDPLVNATAKGIKPKQERLNIYKAQEAKLQASGLQRLKEAQSELLKNKNFTFEVAATEALKLEPNQLLGIKRPAKVDANILKKQDDLNRQIFDKSKTELRTLKIKEPIQGIAPAVGAAPPSCWWGDAWLTPVKRQCCGSCWAFAAAAAYEHSAKKFYGHNHDVAEQDIISCGKTSGGYDAGGCAGGSSAAALDYIRYYGTCGESVFPAQCKDAPCVRKPKALWAYCWGQVYPNRWPTTAEIKSYVRTYGAVVTYMKAGLSTFYAYSNGVYNGYPSTDPYNVDHAVTIVGWCDAMNAWIIKNSWGTNWGYSGYAYVNYNACNIGKWVFWVYPRPAAGNITAPLVSETVPIL